MLAGDINPFVRCVLSRVSVPLNSNQLGALVAFAYNVGCHGFTTSKLLHFVNGGHFDKVSGGLSGRLRGKRVQGAGVFFSVLLSLCVSMCCR